MIWHSEVPVYIFRRFHGSDSFFLSTQGSFKLSWTSFQRARQPLSGLFLPLVLTQDKLSDVKPPSYRITFPWLITVLCPAIYCGPHGVDDGIFVDIKYILLHHLSSMFCVHLFNQIQVETVLELQLPFGNLTRTLKKSFFWWCCHICICGYLTCFFYDTFYRSGLLSYSLSSMLSSFRFKSVRGQQMVNPTPWNPLKRVKIWINNLWKDKKNGLKETLKLLSVFL